MYGMMHDYAEAYLNKLYIDNLPGWDSGIAGNSDEANGESSILYGQLQHPLLITGRIHRLEILIFCFQKLIVEVLIQLLKIC